MALNYALLFGAALMGALFFTPLVRSLALRFGVLDQPGGRKVHQGSVPRLGGAAVLLAILFPCLGGYGLDAYWAREIEQWIHPFLGLTLGSLIVFAVGVWDDIRRLPPWPKLAGEVGAALIAYAFGLRIQLLTNPFGLSWDVSWLSLPLTVIWLVGITNALNLADGIDGLAAGITTFAAAVLFFMTVPTVYTLVPFLTAPLAGASLGFLFYNFSPATIFLGDSGSLFLGFFLGGLSLWASEKSTIAFALLIPIIALGLPILDMIYAVLRRWHRGVSLGQADRDHIHHKLLEKGYSHRKAVIVLYGVNLLLASAAGLLLLTRNSLAAHVIIVLGLVIVFGSRFLGYFRFSGNGRTLTTRWKEGQRLKYLDFRIRWLLQAFETEKSVKGRWGLMGELFEEMGIIQAHLMVHPGGEFLSWAPAEAPSENGPTAALTVPIRGGNGMEGRMEIRWKDKEGLFPLGMSRVLNLMHDAFLRDLEK
jgi:UDP-GlcNAc:undecaprenyl-phosphate GlcNAc-1-phosphate transferase